MPAAKGTDHRATMWLSHNLAEVAHSLNLGSTGDTEPDAPHFDVVIVGSGYGGAVALRELAGHANPLGKPLRIAMLERGKEYLPGSFPSRMADLAGHIRFSSMAGGDVRGEHAGLFDMRLGPDVDVLLANGLGGGSLINAGVMERPKEQVFEDARWPEAISSNPPTEREFAEVRSSLRAVPAKDYLGRSKAMEALGGATVPCIPHITVARRDEAPRSIKKCIECGDCTTGCNVGSKLSVDVTLLADAWENHPPDSLTIVTGATVDTFAARKDYGWNIAVVHTDLHLRVRQVAPYVIGAGTLIIAGGALGSTELLMRARSGHLHFSPALGHRFSANGDNLAALYGMAQPTKGAADEELPLSSRMAGPTITRMIDLRANPDAQIVIQDLGIPGPLRRMYQEVLTTVNTVDSLTRCDRTNYKLDSDASREDCAGLDDDVLGRSMVVAVIGHDAANGRLEFPEGKRPAEEGSLGVVWPEVKETGSPLELHQVALESLVTKNKAALRTLRNPVWRPLPKLLEGLWGDAEGAALSVHPLGGCAMGELGARAVVNHLGQVFKGPGTDVYRNLVVLDGSIIPTSLGINPSLTIATLVRRAIRKLRDDEWKFMPLKEKGEALPVRPKFRDPPSPVKSITQVQVTERMNGTLTIATGKRSLPCDMSLELWFKELSVSDLIHRTSTRTLVIDPKRSRLRLLECPDAPALVVCSAEKMAKLGTSEPPKELVVAKVEGTLTLMRHATSRSLFRTLRALCAWVINRGLRDFVQNLIDKILRRPRVASSGLFQLLKAGWRLASRAGDVRLLEYRLRLKDVEVEKKKVPSPNCWEKEVEAVKRLTYECAANPLNQLMHAQLIRFPNAVGALPILRVDLPYFASTGVPLIRVASQTDQPGALVDMASLGLYFLRVLLPLHAWTLRLPDRPLPRVPRRLPGAIPGVKGPDIEELAVGVSIAGHQTHLRLSRYRPAGEPKARPVMLIHGYSASGTTFVHPTLPGGGLVGVLCAKGRDVWVLDLRSSAGMPTAQHPWAFEEMGCQDIPLAVDHICAVTRQQKVDIVAHCMGAAMLSLGMFGDWKGARFDLYPELREKLPKRIERLVFSQVGPALLMSPANVARAYIMQWLRHYLQLGAFDLRPPEVSLAGQDMIDRALSAVPYPKEDFARENPFWPPWKRTSWVGTRHRMDSLYGITFKLAGMPDRVLDAIDDFFGPLSLETVAQVITFARYGVVTDRRGDGSSMLPSRVSALQGPILCLHSSENGLVDIGTRKRLAALLQTANRDVCSVELQDMGHQDSLIGNSANLVYERIAEFLTRS